MEKEVKLTTKYGIIAAGAMAIVVTAAILIILFGKSKEAYRSIQIYDVKGTASIERNGIGMMEAVENLYLESGDRITVSGDSYIRLKLDDDKYIMVEENSVLSIIAEGTKQNSLTTIQLEQGAVTNEIRNPLSDKSSYEVSTPNSVMAVRGTVFRVSISSDENGTLYTTLDTFEGAVGVRRILPDGSIQEEDAFISGGNEVIIYMDEKITEYLSEPQAINYEELPIQTLYFLQDSMDSGRELSGINSEKIETLITKKSQEEGDTDPAQIQNLNDNETAENISDLEENPFDSVKDEIVEEVTVQTLTTDDGVTDEQIQQPEQEQPHQEPIVEQPSDDSSDSTSDPNETPSGDTPSDDSSDSNDTPSEDTPSDDTEEDDDDESSDKTSYTVTFCRSDGSTFGTQTVKSGEKAVAPTLQPAASGKWDFDFTQSINADTKITWTN